MVMMDARNRRSLLKAIGSTGLMSVLPEAAFGFNTGEGHVLQEMADPGMRADFNPQPTAPDASLHDETATISDKRTFKPSDLFDNTLSYTRYSAGTWPHGPQGLVITPVGNYGNYFAQQERSANKLG